MDNKDVQLLKKCLVSFDELENEINERNKKILALRKKRNEVKDDIVLLIKKNKLKGEFTLSNSTILFETKETQNTLSKKLLKNLLDDYFTRHDNVNTIERRLSNADKCYKFIIGNLGKKKIESLIKKKK